LWYFDIIYRNLFFRTFNLDFMKIHEVEGKIGSNSMTVRSTVLAINTLLTNKIIVFSRGSSASGFNRPSAG